MAKHESYDDLLLKLGDLARERLATKPTCPRSMRRVFKAEEAVSARRQELVTLEAQLNAEDEGLRQFYERQAIDKAEQEQAIRRVRKAVDAVLRHVDELRKGAADLRDSLEYERREFARSQARHAELEMTMRDPRKLELSKQSLKRSRVALMRKERQLEELQHELDTALTPRPGQPGAAGILAQKRLWEMEDEERSRRKEAQARMAELEQEMVAKEEELKAAEEYLDQALLLVGEDCYAARIADPVLAPLYPRIDKVR